MRKRVLAAVLTLAMMFSLSVSASAANTTIRTEDVKISVDGKAIDVPKGSIWISEDGYTMVGARALAEGFGMSLELNEGEERWLRFFRRILQIAPAAYMLPIAVITSISFVASSFGVALD